MHKSTDLPAEVLRPKPEVLGGELRLLDRYEVQTILVQALEKTEHHRHLAEKVEGCHKQFRGRCCDQNHQWAVAQNSCACRLCAHCAHRRAGVMGRRIKTLTEDKTELRYVVLAERSCKNLKKGILSLFKGWNSLRRSVRWKGKVIGAIAVLEVTYNKKERTFHPHLNVLIEGEYFPFAELNFAWKKATKGNGQTTHIQQANEGTIRELVKYTMKVAERDENGKLQLILDDPSVLDEYLAAVYGVRLVRSYGSFRKLKTADEEAPNEEECPDCASKCIVDTGPVQQGQLSFDFDKQVFRVARGPDKKDRALHFVRPRPPRTFSTNPDAIGIAVEARRQRTHYERAVSALFDSEAA